MTRGESWLARSWESRLDASVKLATATLTTVTSSVAVATTPSLRRHLSSCHCRHTLSDLITPPMRFIVTTRLPPYAHDISFAVIVLVLRLSSSTIMFFLLLGARLYIMTRCYVPNGSALCRCALAPSTIVAPPPCLTQRKRKQRGAQQR